MLSIIVRRFGDSLAGVWLLAAVLRSEVYAFEQQYLHEEPPRELKLQAIRIGDLGIAALPDEAFGITGLKLKQASLQSLLGRIGPMCPMPCLGAVISVGLSVKCWLFRNFAVTFLQNDDVADA
jgi:hypothetical protein